MKELSLHILDIVQNSIKAGAGKIEIIIDENSAENILTIEINDNGCGMSEEFLKKVKDPFVTTRTTRKMGMGISLFEATAVQCGGGLEIWSELGVGTKVKVTFELNHIDRAPIGDMAETMLTIISGAPQPEYVYRHTKDGREFLLDTLQLKNILGDIPLDTPDVLTWIVGFVKEGLADIDK
ncbi:MAG: ATP-binding protein [Clostridia bacterium]|nr:ATP-binding protein [Clostridia bacterium]